MIEQIKLLKSGKFYKSLSTPSVFMRAISHYTTLRCVFYKINRKKELFVPKLPFLYEFLGRFKVAGNE